MNNIMTILKKEFLVFVRDRRTLIMTIVTPLILYPVMFSMIGMFTSRNREELKTSQYNVYFAQSVPTEMESFIPEEDNIVVLRTVDGDPMKLLDKDRLKAVVVMDDKLEIRYMSSERKSREAASRILSAAKDYRESLVKKVITDAGLPDTVLTPFEVERKDVASKEKVSGMFLGRLLPYMIIIMLFSGAMGFGLEVSTGEKEKGTIATLLVSQASRSQIVLGKLLYVVGIEIIYGLLNIVGFVVAAGMQASMFNPKLAEKAAETAAGSGGGGFAFAIMPHTFLLLILLILPIALIAASLIIAIGSYAKSMKEGQTIFTPLLMVFILIGIISMTAPMKVPEYYFWIPVLNTSFAMQELLTFKFQLGHFLTTIFTTTGTAALIIGVSIWLFNRESIHFRS